MSAALCLQPRCYIDVNLAMEWTFDLESINDVAKECLTAFGNGNVVAIHGEMGAGKTTFVHALCYTKGVKDTVGSPTFSIINEYTYADNGASSIIYHIDLYRLKDEEEAIRTGVEDCLYSNYLCFVEWPERAAGIFPPDTIHIYIEAIGTQRRKLRIGNN